MKKFHVFYSIWSVTYALFLVPPDTRGDPIFVPQQSPYVPDANTSVLEHFDSSTSGTTNGLVTYTNGVFGQGVHLAQLGSYVMVQPGDIYWRGTVEFWGKFDVLPAGDENFVQFAWTDNILTVLRIGAFGSRPHAGYAATETMDWIGVPTAQLSLPYITAGWHHYAMTWGEQGFHFYYDGARLHSSTNTSPLQIPSYSVIGGIHAALSYDLGCVGAVDEFRISTIQRTFAPLPSLKLERRSNGGVVLTWDNPAFALQASGSPLSTFTNVPNATSPHIIPQPGLQAYFRLAR